MDDQFRDLLRALLEKDPDVALEDDDRQAVMYAMLALHPSEHLAAIWRFGESITDEFKRSYLFNHLVRHSAQCLEFDLAERIARSIPTPYWRFAALNKVAAELLRRDGEFGSIGDRNSSFHERALRLLREIEESLPLIPDNDDDRATVLWGVGLSLVNAGKLEWAEDLASTANYCPENTEVLLRCAKARASRDQTHHAVRLARMVGRLACEGTGQLTNRAFDLEDAAELIFDSGGKEEARKLLEEAARFALASQAHDIDGCKCAGAIAIAFAKQGYIDLAQETANMITQPARREHALQKIAEHF